MSRMIGSLCVVTLLGGCLSEYELVPLGCENGTHGRLYGLTFSESHEMALFADVVCVDRADDVQFEVRVSEDPEDTFLVDLAGCRVERNPQDRSKVDLYGCVLDSPYRLGMGTECVVTDWGGTDVRLVVDQRRDAEPEVLDELYLPVNLQPE